MNNEPLAHVIVRALKSYEDEYGSHQAVNDLQHLMSCYGLSLSLSTSDLVSMDKTNLVVPEFVPKSVPELTVDNVVSVQEQIVWTPSQELALGKLRSWLSSVKASRTMGPEAKVSRFFLLRGYAGTGKSFLMKTVLDENSSVQNLLFSAPTHQAARILSAYVGRTATTVASRLGVKAVYQEDQVEFALPDRLPYIPPKSVLIVDESSMLNKDYVKFLVKLAEELDIYILFVGDPLQLPPVGERRSSVWSLTRDNEFRHTLVDVKRTSQPNLLGFLLGLRSEIISKTYENHLREFASPGEIDCVHSGRDFLRSVRDSLDQFKDGSAKIVAWRNKKVDYYSEVVRTLLGHVGPVSVGDRLRLSGPFVPYESFTTGEVGVATEEVLVTSVNYSTLTPNLNGAQWSQLEIPVIVAEIEGQTFEKHAVAIPDPTRDGEKIFGSLLNSIAVAARNASRSDARVYWEHFWTTKGRFIKPKSAYTNTAHTFQGSQAKTVFMDTEDILSNPVKAEAFRCWYVASSRSTERLVSN